MAQFLWVESPYKDTGPNYLHIYKQKWMSCQLLLKKKKKAEYVRIYFYRRIIAVHQVNRIMNSISLPLWMLVYFTKKNIYINNLPIFKEVEVWGLEFGSIDRLFLSHLSVYKPGWPLRCGLWIEGHLPFIIKMNSEI